MGKITIRDIMNVTAGEMFLRSGWNVDMMIQQFQLMILIFSMNPLSRFTETFSFIG